MNKIAIIASTDRGLQLGILLRKEFDRSVLVSTRPIDESGAVFIRSIGNFLEEHFSSFDAYIFIGALGICVRSIAMHLDDKNTDPGIINMDEMGNFVQAVVGGHAGGANALCLKVAAITGAQPVITTSTDLQHIWSLDTLGNKYSWHTAGENMNQSISLFANNQPTALLLDLKDAGTAYLEKTKPSFVDVFYDDSCIDFAQYQLCIVVTYKQYSFPIPTVFYHAQVLNIGTGCRRNIEFPLFENSLREQITASGLVFESIQSIASIDVKHDEVALMEFSKKYKIPFITYHAGALNSMRVPTPSEVVMKKLGVHSVSEASAMLLSGNEELLVKKQKISLASGKKYTFAIALSRSVQRKAVIAIVGAGPGDPDLISVKGRQLLSEADLILYAGSLVPEALTAVAKAGAIVRNSASMTLEDQMTLMDEHYSRGHLIIRLQSGDPSIYGAIQEQMHIFDEKGMDYFIVPGISSFQAAAACLQSEFTIPELVQSIILTRGEGNTPLPEREKISEMARHRATMCIFLSATIAKTVQSQLLEHYPEDTPVAVLYRVTWQDEEVYTGTLKELADIIRRRKLTRTVLIIVGDAIGARKNRSQLYHPEHKHIFRTGKQANIKPKRIVKQ
jgi:precorrin-4 C11-methyltransferase